MATISAAFGKFSSNNKGSVQNFGIVGITIASEELTKFIFFYCPCNHLEAKFYGSTFIWGPAAILFVVGYLVNRRTWRLMTGLCNRTQGVGKGCKRVFHFIYTFSMITMKASIAPSTWLVISLLKGDYYACANWPHPADTDPKYFSIASEAEVIARDLRATSHLIGWWFVCVALIMGVVFMLASKCMSRYSYEQGKYIERYRSHEVTIFEDALDAKAKEQAQRIVDGYFVRPRSKEEWDQIAVINDKITKSKRGRPIYSPLHKFVNKELLLEAERKGETMDFGLVGDAAIKKRSLAKNRHESDWQETDHRNSRGKTFKRSLARRRPSSSRSQQRHRDGLHGYDGGKPEPSFRSEDGYCKTTSSDSGQRDWRFRRQHGERDEHSTSTNQRTDGRSNSSQRRKSDDGPDSARPHQGNQHFGQP